jgi:NTE family protein
MIGVAFEGCACRAAFHAGVAAALVEGKVPVAVAAGASSGSLCAAAFAAGRAADLPSLWRSLSGRSVVSLRRIRWNRSIFDMSHLVRTTLRETLGSADLRGGPVEALVTATRLPDLSRMVYSSREEADFIEPLLGSCFFPLLYGRPVRHRGSWLLDGGVRDNLPIELLVERGATEVIAVVPSPEGMSFKSLRARRWRPSATGVKVHVVHPRKALALRSWDFDPDRMARAIDEGHARGREFAGY